MKKVWKQLDGQQSLFDVTELEADLNQTLKNLSLKRETVIIVNPADPKEAELIKAIHIRGVPCDILKQDMFCNQCGADLKLIGHERIRE